MHRVNKNASPSHQLLTEQLSNLDEQLIHVLTTAPSDEYEAAVRDWRAARLKLTETYQLARYRLGIAHTPSSDVEEAARKAIAIASQNAPLHNLPHGKHQWAIVICVIVGVLVVSYTLCRTRSQSQ